jgi:hypothetical protein
MPEKARIDAQIRLPVMPVVILAKAEEANTLL